MDVNLVLAQDLHLALNVKFSMVLHFTSNSQRQPLVENSALVESIKTMSISNANNAMPPVQLAPAIQFVKVVKASME